MKMWFKFGLVMALFGVFGSALAGDDLVTETRAVDARVTRVKLDGVIDLKLKWGATPSLVISGDKKWVEKTSTVQSGDTLHIDTDSHGFKMHKNSLKAELTLPNLRELSSEGVGMSTVTGFNGDQLELLLDGAGAMKVNCNYKTVTATLGGIGSMHIQGANSDGIDLNLRGAGYVTLNGNSKWLKATLGGLGGLDAKQFQTDSVNLELSGLGNATVTASQSATLNLSGMGSVTVYGKPQNRNVVVDGLGKVSWK